MKKIKYMIVLVASFFLFNSNVLANSYNKVDIEVKLNNDGSADFYEKWYVDTNKDTEIYMQATDLGKRQIKNLEVSENGRKYTNLGNNWNINASFDSKAYKSGIHPISNGVELCWGISSYDSHEYEVKFTVTNVVQQYKDKQALDYVLFGFGETVDKVNIKIYKDDYNFTKENAKIWAFGYDGEIEFNNGSIIMYTRDAFRKDDYMSALVGFEEDIFEPEVSSNMTFKQLYNKGMKGVKLRERYRILGILFGILSAVFSILVFLVVFIAARYYTKKNGYHFDDGNKLPKDKDLHYFRDIPCDKSILKAIFLAKNYGINKNLEANKGVIGAYLLKWIRDEKIKVKDDGTGKFNKNKFALDITNLVEDEKMDPIEKKLLSYVKKAAKDNYLEAKELTTYFRNQYDEINSWIKKIDTESEKIYMDEGMITKEERPIKIFLGWKKNTNVKCVNPLLKQEAINLAGLKKYLLNFGSVPDKKAVEVHLWEEYMIFASILGIAKEVNKEFAKLYPELANMTELNDQIIYISTNSYSGYRSSYNSHHYSSGSGGSSFSGGGSFGGFSGGGSR